MKRQVLAIMTAIMIGTIITPSTGQGSDWDEFWARFDLDTKRNEAWPQPFLAREQSQVRQPFAMMVARGWQEQNTLTEYHFDPEEGVLNQAGIFKVQSILRSSPQQHQSIFVYAGFDPVVNQTRMEIVQRQVAQWVPRDSAPAIVMTNHRPYGIPGQQADSINRRFQESLPAPTIPVGSGGGAGAGGAGGGN